MDFPKQKPYSLLEICSFHPAPSNFLILAVQNKSRIGPTNVKVKRTYLKLKILNEILLVYGQLKLLLLPLSAKVLSLLHTNAFFFFLGIHW